MEWLDGKTATKGEALKVPKELLSEIFGEGDDSAKEMEVTTFTLTLKGTETIAEQECAVFAVKVVMKGEPEEGLEFKMELKGEVVVGIRNCWPT